MCVYAHVFCVWIHLSVCACICLCACVSTYMHGCVNVGIYMYICQGKHIEVRCQSWVLSLKPFTCFFLVCSFVFKIVFLTTFLPSLSSLQTLSYTPPWSPSNSWPLYSSIVIACIYVFVYTHIFPNRICWVHIVLLYVCLQGWLALDSQELCFPLWMPPLLLLASLRWL